MDLTVKSNIHQCSDRVSLQALAHDIRDNVRSAGYAVVRGLFEADALIAARTLLASHIATTEILSTSGVSREAIRSNVVKWSIGSNSGSQSDISRFMLTAMNPMFEPDIYGMRGVFSKLIEARDVLAGRDKVYFDNDLKAPSFNGTRIQIYPSGGGFMTEHIDKKSIEDAAYLSKDYIQLVLLLTEKGNDFTSGGAFLRLDGKKVDVESGCLVGDVLVYDGQTLHGVDDVDAHLPLDLSRSLGRVVALATIFS